MNKNLPVEKMAYIRQNFQIMPVNDIAAHLQIDEKRVRGFIRTNCRKGRNRPPTDDIIMEKESLAAPTEAPEEKVARK